MQSSSTSSRAKWSLITGATGPLCVVNPRPHVPSSAVTTQASGGQLGVQSRRMRLYRGYLDIGFATSALSDHEGRRARASGAGVGNETGNATISLIFIDEASRGPLTRTAAQTVVDRRGRRQLRSQRQLFRPREKLSIRTTSVIPAKAGIHPRQASLTSSFPRRETLEQPSFPLNNRHSREGGNPSPTCIVNLVIPAKAGIQGLRSIRPARKL